jgi:uncharacterized protein (TIGR03435 family)
MKQIRSAFAPKRIAALCLAFGLLSTPQFGGQSVTPGWQTAAGGKMSFDIASVKSRPWDPRGPGASAQMNFPLDIDDTYAATGGLLSDENLAIVTYIIFAYKLTPDESAHVYDGLPKWAHTEHFDIEARGPANATKDQMRLMMQSLLADRFKLAVHWKDMQVPVFSVVLARAAKTGPQLQPSSQPPCASTSNQGPPTGSSVASCVNPFMRTGFLPNGENKMEGRAEPIQQIVANLHFSPGTGIDRPLVDGTGLSGTYDFTLVWLPDRRPGQEVQDVSGPSYVEALKDQLGLKLVATTGPSHYLVLDHIEEPSPN